MKKKLLNFGWGVALSIIFQTSLAQVREPYSNLDLEAITSRFFYPQTFKDISVPDPDSDDNLISPANASRLINYFDMACLDEHLYIDDFATFRQNVIAGANAENIIPLVLLDITYHDFIEGAVSQGLITYDGNHFYDGPAYWMNPYEEKNAVILWTGLNTYESEILNFKLREEWFITNREDIPDVIEIDFDDGLGFRTVGFDELIEVDYTSVQAEREVRIKIQHGESWLKGGNLLKSKVGFDPCATTAFPFPTPPPWPVEQNQFSNWLISSDAGDLSAQGNAYTLVSNDGVFDKPFLFIEGIDFGMDDNMLDTHEQYQNGTFGWCQFSSGFLDPDLEDALEYGYEMLHLMPEVLTQLREEGYDIVLVDFFNGADFLEKNSTLVQHVIRLCNEYKSGDEPLIVAGASMGGLICKHAIRSMELNGEEPCIRLWISLDSPHGGANIPAALQESIIFNASNGITDAANFRDKFLMTAAARQLLNYQATNYESMRYSWFNTYEQTGYPVSARSLAISNGLGTGTGLIYPHPRLMDWQCTMGLKQWMFPNSGDPTLADEGPNKFGHFKTIVTGANAAGDDWLAYIGALASSSSFPLTSDFFDIEERKVFAVPGQYNWDYAPGGTRRNLKTYADAFNFGIMEAPTPANECNHIDPSEYNDFQCFVPAISAVGLIDLDPYIPLEAYLYDHPEERFFDRVVFAESRNERHCELTEYNTSIMLDEILGPERSGLNSELTINSANAGVFNYGRQEFTWLKDLHVHNGGHLLINKYSITHFAQEQDFINIQPHFDLTTISCSPSEVLIDNNGLMEIGDQYFNGRTADVTLNRDSRITVGSDGTLKIFKDSQLILNEGSELVLYPGGYCEVDNGSIVLNPGSKLIIKAGNAGESTDLILLNENSRLVCNGGSIVIEDNAKLLLSGWNGTSGFIDVLPGNTVQIHNGINSLFSLIGSGNEDLLLNLPEGSALKTTNGPTGIMKIKQCKVEMGALARIETQMMFNCGQVLFNGFNATDETDNASVKLMHSTASISSSTFSSLIYYSVETNSSIFTSQFTGTEIIVHGGGYRIVECDFHYSHIKSYDLETVSAVSNCSFTGGNTNHIMDFSLVELLVKSNSFTDIMQPAIDKTGGKLSLRCNLFSDVDGILVTDGDLNMSSADAAGYNVFENTPVCIHLDGANTIDLFKGYNDFSGFESFYINGTMNRNCYKLNQCTFHIDAYHNYWGEYEMNDIQPNDEIPGPRIDFMQVSSVDHSPCSGYDKGGETCHAVFHDLEPAQPEQCPTRIKLEVKTKSQWIDPSEPYDVEYVLPHGMLKDLSLDIDSPLINTPAFNNVSLDSALVFAAMQMETYDSLGNDLNAVHLFHEILTSDLNQENLKIRGKMNWGRYNMKTAMENLFNSGELLKDNNLMQFEEPVQEYVDILNVMTDTALADSTYKMQFYLELDKGQLFRTIGKPLIAQQIFSHLDECQLDSIEQVILNNWRERVDLEISFYNQYYNLGVSPDSMEVIVDTSDYTMPVPYASSNYYFGLWIDSPNEVTFVSCGNDPVYRFATTTSSSFSVFPNPAGKVVYVQGLNTNENVRFVLIDMRGAIISDRKINTGMVGAPMQISLPSMLASGSYILRISTDMLTEDHRIVITGN